MTFLNNLRFIKFKYKYRKQNFDNFTEPSDFIDLNKLKIGKKTYGTIKVLNQSPRNDIKLEIGNYCSIAKGVTFILGGEHNISTLSTYPFKSQIFAQGKEAKSKGSIIIKDDVWIGYNATICSGITIGQGAVIATGSIVIKDIPPYAIVGGNPAKIIKYRFPESIIQKLLEVNVSELFDKLQKQDIEKLYTEINENNIDELLK